jgi:hypothetical protein
LLVTIPPLQMRNNVMMHVNHAKMLSHLLRRSPTTAGFAADLFTVGK